MITPAPPLMRIQAIQELSEFPALTEATRQALARCHKEQQTQWLLSSELPEDGNPLPLDFEQAGTPWGNLLEIFDRGINSEQESELLAILYLLALIPELPASAERLQSIAKEFRWLSDKLALPIFEQLQACLSDYQEPIRVALVGSLQTESPFTELPFLTWLLTEPSGEGKTALLSTPNLAPGTRRFYENFKTQPTFEVSELNGNIHVESRKALTQTLQLLCGWSAIRGGLSTFARIFFGAKQRGTLKFYQDGLLLKQSHWWMGKLRSEREEFIPWSTLQGASIQRSNRLIFTVLGFSALALGTLLGVKTLGSMTILPDYRFKLFAWGISYIGLGMLFEYAFGALADFGRNKSCVELKLPTGERWQLHGIAPERATTALSQMLLR